MNKNLQKNFKVVVIGGGVIVRIIVYGTLYTI